MNASLFYSVVNLIEKTITASISNLLCKTNSNCNKLYDRLRRVNSDDDFDLVFYSI